MSTWAELLESRQIEDGNGDIHSIDDLPSVFRGDLDLTPIRELEHFTVKRIYGTLTAAHLGYVADGHGRVHSLDNLPKVFVGDLILRGARGNKALTNVEVITGSLMCGSSSYEDLGSVRRIGLDLNLGNSQVTSLGALSLIGRDGKFRESKIKSLGGLTIIRRDFIARNLRSLQDTGELTVIGRHADFQNAGDIKFRKLKVIGGNADFDDSKTVSLGSIEVIGGSLNSNAAYPEPSQLSDLGQLRLIRGDASFGPLVRLLGSLDSIGGDAFFHNSRVNLGNTIIHGKIKYSSVTYSSIPIFHRHDRSPF